jgi:hypothetical protein
MFTRRPFAAFASLFLFGSLVIAAPATAFAADETGSAGSVDKVEINTPSADAYLQYHGRVVVQTGKSTKNEYRWGGTSCGSRVVEEDLIAILVQASRNSDVVVTPRFQLGQGDVKCLVGFSIQEKR